MSAEQRYTAAGLQLTSSIPLGQVSEIQRSGKRGSCRFGTDADGDVLACQNWRTRVRDLQSLRVTQQEIWRSEESWSWMANERN